jgi:Rieske 2Fe-2S family protein
VTRQLERSTQSEDLTDLIGRRSPGLSLETPFYTAQDVFDLDIAAIFSTHWLFVTAEAEVPEPGDFITVTIGPYSVIVVRDDDREVRAFHNVCRHRGSRILDADRGSVGNLVCPYHRWTYNVDGRLLHADNQSSTFDKNRFGLRPVQVRNLSGLVFICLGDQAPTDVDDVAARVAPYLAPYELWRTKVAHQVDIVEHGNWKLVMENNRECYHCEGHPELISAYFPLHGYTADDVPPRLRRVWDRYEKAGADLRAACVRQGFPLAAIRELDSRATGFMISHAPLDGAGKSYTAGGESVSGRRLGTLETDRFGDLHVHFQPNSWFHVLADHAVAFTALPLARDRTLLRTTWLVHADAVEGVDYDVPSLTAIWRATNAQDSTFVARAQRGVQDPGYRPGPYSTVERDVEAFVSWYISRISNHLASRP